LGDDVAQLGLVAVAIDLRHQAESDERAAGVDRGESHAGPLAAPLLIGVDPGAGEVGWRRLGDPGEAQHLGVGHQRVHVIAPASVEGLKGDVGQRRGALGAHTVNVSRVQR
jgi:hypothetical protein